VRACTAPDELIRQVAIESPERGLLLMRVRDEVRMTISAYRTLYQSSITFGMRKTLQAEQGNSELIKRVGAAEEAAAAAAGQGGGTWRTTSVAAWLRGQVSRDLSCCVIFVCAT